MLALMDWIRSRFMPAVLTAAGVALVSAGLVNYGSSVEATVATPSPTISQPTPTPTLLPFPSVGPSASLSGGSTAPRVATRIVVPALGIDLPVIRSPADEKFPFCNVAEYLPAFSQPGHPGTTYLYAHARDGMFLPLLTQSRIDSGSAMLGMIAQVYTSDDQVFLYDVTRVLRHQADVSNVVSQPGPQLALQTSEGPRKGLPGYTGLVLIVIAQPLSSGPVDHGTANPPAHPLACQ